MTRIQELEKEIKLIKELIELKKTLNSIPQYQYPYYLVYPYWYNTSVPYTISNTAGTVSDLNYNKSTSTTGYVTTGYVTSGFSQPEFSKQVDGPGSYTSTYTVGHGG